MSLKKRHVVLLFLTFIIAPIGSAQNPGRPRPGVNARDPRPEEAVRAILTAFKSFRVVAIGDHHSTKDTDDFVLLLVRHPEFPNSVNDIVVENLNSMLQPTLDRYVAGEDVPITEARRLWQEVWNPTGGVRDFTVQLIQLVRRINQKLPPGKRLRVLAPEPPKDWSKPGTGGNDGNTREEHIASVVEQEVLAKNRKALMSYGMAHVVHGSRNMAKERYEQKFPGVTFVIEPYIGLCDFPLSLDSTPAQVPEPLRDQLKAYETRMMSWPVPSLIQTKGTWMADLAKWKWTTGLSGAMRVRDSRDPIDAYLYLGSPDLLLATQPSVFTFTDKTYLDEIRQGLGAKAERIGIRVDPDKVRELDSDVLRCNGTRLIER